MKVIVKFVKDRAEFVMMLISSIHDKTKLKEIKWKNVYPDYKI